jgi:RimJ/RimL family protein N-acetyltransferase
MSTFETDRMVLRPFTVDDADAVYGIFSDPVAMRFSITGVRDRAATAVWLARAISVFDEHGYGFWAAILKETGAYVGHAGLLPQEVEGRREVEIAYWFLQSHWNRGLATEAARACRDRGFRELDRRRLISLIVPENVASRRVAEKVGMILEREVVWKNTRMLMYARTR